MGFLRWVKLSLEKKQPVFLNEGTLDKSTLGSQCLPVCGLYTGPHIENAWPGVFRDICHQSLQDYGKLLTAINKSAAQTRFL